MQRSMYAEMVDKEQQINESNQMYGQLQDQLELMLDTIARETNDIKQLEQQLNEGMNYMNQFLIDSMCTATKCNRRFSSFIIKTK